MYARSIERRRRRLSRTTKAQRTGRASLRRRRRAAGRRHRMRMQRQHARARWPPARRCARCASTSSRRSRPNQARCHNARAVCSIGATTGPRTRTAKSSRGASVQPWFRSLRSSMMLMPPTKPTSPSTAHSLWCRRRNWLGCSSRHQRSTGRNTASATSLPSSRSRSMSQRALGAEAVDDDAHAHAAPRRLDQRIAQRAGGIVVVKDVGRDPDLVPRAADRLAHRRQQRVAAAQQLDLVAAEEGRRRPAEARGARAPALPPRVRARPSALAPARRPAAGGPTCAPMPRRAARTPTCSAGRACRCGRARTAARATETCSAAPRAAPAPCARCRPIARIGASSRSPQSLKSPATTSSSSRGTCAAMKSRQPLHLPHAAGVHQPEVRDDRVQRRPGHCTGTCSRPRCSKRWSRHVVVADVADRPARQQRVAVLAVARDRVGAVGDVVAFGREEVGLPLVGPAEPGALEAARVERVEAPHLLQEHEIGVERFDAEPEVVDLQPLARPDAAHALVDVVGGHAQQLAGVLGRRRTVSSSRYAKRGSCRIASALLGEKQRSAASRHGSQA